MLLFGHGGSAPRRRRRIRRRPGRYTHLLVCRGQGRSRARLLRRNRLRRIRLEVRRPRLRPPPPHRPLALPRPWPKRGAARPRPRVVRRHLRPSRCRDRRGGPEESGHPRSFDGRPGRARIPPPPSGAGARTRAHLRKLWPSARHLPRLADAEDDVPRPAPGRRPLAGGHRVPLAGDRQRRVGVPDRHPPRGEREAGPPRGLRSLLHPSLRDGSGALPGHAQARERAFRRGPPRARERADAHRGRHRRYLHTVPPLRGDAPAHLRLGDAFRAGWDARRSHRATRGHRSAAGEVALAHLRQEAPGPRRLLSMRRIALALALLCAGTARAADPRFDWQTIDTPHFEIHFHQGEYRFAARLARMAEAAHARLSPLLDHVPDGRTQVVLTDDTDFANGSASPVLYTLVHDSRRRPIRAPRSAISTTGWRSFSTTSTRTSSTSTPSLASPRPSTPSSVSSGSRTARSPPGSSRASPPSRRATSPPAAGCAPRRRR